MSREFNRFKTNFTRRIEGATFTMSQTLHISTEIGTRLHNDNFNINGLNVLIK